MELGKVFVPVENSKTYSVGTCLGHPTPAAQVTTRLPRHSLTATADTLIATTHPPDPATPTRGLSYWYSTCRARIIQVILFCEKEAWKPWKPMERSLYTIHLLPSHNFGLFRICRILRFLIYCSIATNYLSILDTPTSKWNESLANNQKNAPKFFRI